MKNKLKTRSSVAKRFQKTKSGKILRRKAFHGHNLEKKSKKRKYNLSKKTIVNSKQLKAIYLMLPN
jgi:large subunit ribosomal protein L35